MDNIYDAVKDARNMSSIIQILLTCTSFWRWFYTTHKIVSEMTYNVMSGMLNPTIPTISFSVSAQNWGSGR